MHGDIVVTSVAFLREHAFAFGILQESFLTETTDDALHGAICGRFWMSAIRYASGSAFAKLGIETAFIDWKSRFGDSEFEGAKTKQQYESKAKGHR